MKKELLRYINILKTVQEIKESIEELKFGSRMKHDWMYCTYILKDMCIWDWENDCDIQIKGFKTFEIIWQIEDRHLRMFLEKHTESGYRIELFWCTIIEYTYDYHDNGHYTLENFHLSEIQLDNKKPHM